MHVRMSSTDQRRKLCRGVDITAAFKKEKNKAMFIKFQCKF